MALRVLWATPRTVSTAFERMVIERGDHLVLDEPWSRAYYFGPDRRSDRHPLVMPESTYGAVTAAVVATAAGRDVFVKDMAYQVLPGLTDDLIDAAAHTVLVREPTAALASLLRGWPDATVEEFGFDALGSLVDRIEARTGALPHVVDADDLRSDPAGTVTRWCAAVGLDHRPEALTWSPGMRPEWPLWQSWYASTAESTGFAPPSSAAVPDVPGPWADAVERAQRLHDRLHPHRLRA